METKFNFNSQVCTDKNQSERLLALGLKKETADMCSVIDLVSDNGKTIEEVDTIFSFIPDDWNDPGRHVTPRWSLHRLIEMMPEEIDRYFCTSFLTLSKHNVYYNESVDGAPDMEFEKNNLYDSIIDCIEWLIKEGHFNKNYLV